MRLRQSSACSRRCRRLFPARRPSRPPPSGSPAATERWPSPSSTATAGPPAGTASTSSSSSRVSPRRSCSRPHCATTPRPDAASEATLRAMITESDNGAAYTVFGRVGAKGMKAVAKAAGMADYEQGAGWVDTRASAADQARLFSRYDSLVPAEGPRPRTRAALRHHADAALGHPRGGRPRGLADVLQGWLARHGQQAHGPGRAAREGQEVVGAGGDERREPHALHRLGHAEGRHRAAARAGADAGVPGRRARVGGRAAGQAPRRVSPPGSRSPRR